MVADDPSNRPGGGEDPSHDPRPDEPGGASFGTASFSERDPDDHAVTDAGAGRTRTIAILVAAFVALALITALIVIAPWDTGDGDGAAETSPGPTAPEEDEPTGEDVPPGPDDPDQPLSWEIDAPDGDGTILLEPDPEGDEHIAWLVQPREDDPDQTEQSEMQREVVSIGEVDVEVFSTDVTTLVVWPAQIDDGRAQIFHDLEGLLSGGVVPTDDGDLAYLVAEGRQDPALIYDIETVDADGARLLSQTPIEQEIVTVGEYPFRVFLVPDYDLWGFQDWRTVGGPGSSATRSIEDGAEIGGSLVGGEEEWHRMALLPQGAESARFIAPDGEESPLQSVATLDEYEVVVVGTSQELDLTADEVRSGEFIWTNPDGTAGSSDGE